MTQEKCIFMTFDPKYSDCVIFLISGSEFIFLTFPRNHQVSTRDEQVIVSCFESWITCCSFLLGSCCPRKASVTIVLSTVEFELLQLRWNPRQFHFFPSQTPHASEIDPFWQIVSTMLELKSQEQPGIEFIEKSYSRA